MGDPDRSVLLCLANLSLSNTYKCTYAHIDTHPHTRTQGEGKALSSVSGKFTLITAKCKAAAKRATTLKTGRCAGVVGDGG